MHIIIDTNFLISAMKNKIQIFEELQKEFPSDKILVPIGVIKELEIMSEDSKYTMEERKIADIAIFMIKKKNISLIPLSTKEVDAGILNYTKQYNKVIVATLDRELKEKIKKVNKNIQFLTIKEKKRIVVQ